MVWRQGRGFRHVFDDVFRNVFVTHYPLDSGTGSLVVRVVGLDDFAPGFSDALMVPEFEIEDQQMIVGRVRFCVFEFPDRGRFWGMAFQSLEEAVEMLLMKRGGRVVFRISERQEEGFLKNGFVQLSDQPEQSAARGSTKGCDRSALRWGVASTLVFFERDKFDGSGGFGR